MQSSAADLFCKFRTRSCRHHVFSHAQSAASVLIVAAVDYSTSPRTPSAAVAAIHRDSAYIPKLALTNGASEAKMQPASIQLLLACAVFSPFSPEFGGEGLGMRG